MKKYMQLMSCLLILSLVVLNGIHAQTKSVPEDPYVPHFITLKSTGNGSFSGESTVNVDGIAKVIKIDTLKSVDLPHGSVVKLTATPEKGWGLLRITAKGTMDMEEETELEVLEGGALTYLLEHNTVVHAYFEEQPELPDTVVVDQEDTEIGTDIPSILEHLEIAGKTGEDSTTVTLKNVTVELPDQVAITKITEDSNVILELEGMVSLDKIENNGNLIIRNTKDGNAKLTCRTVENMGVFIDESGLVTVVEGSVAALAITPLKDQTIKEGEKVVLTAKADARLDAEHAYSLTFLWERLSGGFWQEISEEEKSPETVFRSMESVSSSLEVLSSEAGKYRCTITNQVGDIVTTLRTFAEIRLQSSDPDPVPTPTSYSITLPSIKGVTTNPVAGTYTVDEGDHFSFTLMLNEGYGQSTPVVKVANEVIEPDGNGKYTISNIQSNLLISITGIDPDTPTSSAEVEIGGLKVWSANGQLHIQTAVVTQAYIITFGGQLYKVVALPVGETVVPMLGGAYIIRIEGQSYKIRF